MADRSHAQFQDGRKPPERVPKSERILNLIAVLLRSEDPVPVTAILGKVTGYDDSASRESLMRRFERDKKVLRDIGIPIEHFSPGAFGQEGYFISRKDYFLGELALPPESGQILRALYAWAHADGGSLSSDLRSALVKVGYLVDSEDEDESPAPDQAREPLSPTHAAEGTGVEVSSSLRILSEAVLRQKRVKFRYYSLGRDEENEREVDPYGLGFSWDLSWTTSAWYLVGQDHLRDGQRVFKVSRIRGEVEFVSPGEEPDYKIPPGFRVRDHLGKTQWEYGDLAAAFTGGEATEPFTAKVGFPPAVATEVRSLVRSARSAGTKGQNDVLEFDVHQRKPFLRFLLRYAPNVKVYSPGDLNDGLRELAQEVLRRYEVSA